MFLPMLLSVLLSPVYAQDLSQTVKVADGTVAQCQNSQDAFQHRMGAYQLKVEGPVVKDEWLLFRVKLDFLSCQQVDQKWGFVKVSALAPLNFQLPGDEVLVETRQAFLQLTRHEQFITQIAWDDDVRTIAIGLKDVVDENELTKLQAGEEIDVAVDFALQKELLLNSKEGLSSEGSFMFGAFRQHFKLKL